jgi:glutaconate CoA-transferase subunit B
MLAHLTSPGFGDGRARGELGLRGDGPHRIITDKAILGFDPESHCASLVSVHPGVSIQDVVEHTGFPLHISDQTATTPLPTEEQLRLLREDIDPQRVYLT